MIICHLVGTDRLSDEWMYLAQCEPSTLHQSSRTPPMLRHLNFYSSAKLSRTSTPDMPIRAPMPLLLQQQPQVPTRMCPPQQAPQCRLHKTSVASLLLLKIELSISQYHVCRLHILASFLTSAHS